MKVFLDERELVDIVSTSTAWTQKEVLFRVSNGTYTLRFVGISREGIDDATTIDCVSLKVARQPACGTLVANAGFEQGTTGIDGWKYFQTDTTVNYNQAAYAHTDVWACSGDAGITQFGNSTWADTPFAGTYALFLQRNARAEQTITLPSDGLYRISFRATGRGGYSGHTVRVKLDDAVIGELYVDARDWRIYEADFTATAGAHVFAVEGEKVLYVKEPSGPEKPFGGDPFTKDDLVERIAELHIGEWRRTYVDPSDPDGIPWRVVIEYEGGRRPVRIVGRGAFPYNFRELYDYWLK